MYNFNFNFIIFLFINYISNICNGCLPSPVIQPSPTIVTSTEAFTQSTCSPNSCTGSFTSSGVTVTTLPVDSNNCIYSIQVSCIDPTVTSITINMNTNLQVNSPTTFICNAMTSTYTFDTTVGSGSINNLECACSPNSCPTTPTGVGVDVTAPTVDAMCVYSVEAQCTDPSLSVIFNMDTSTAVDDAILTCNSGVYQYGTPPTTITSIECGCAPISCPTTPSGTGVDVTAPTVDAMCVYSVEAQCTDARRAVIFNMDISTAVDDAILTCNNGVYQYGTPPTTITSIECGCRANRCSLFIAQDGAVLSTPTPNARCMYTAQVSCTDPKFSLIFNSDPNSATIFPKTLTCNNNGLWFSASVGTVANVVCRCVPQCGYTRGPGAEVTDPVNDGNCDFTAVASCTNPLQSLIFDFDTNSRFPSPQTLTCDIAARSYYINTPPTQQYISNIECQCPENVCPITFTALGPDIIVSDPVADDNCIYEIMATCPDPSTLISINEATDNIQAGQPVTITCNAATMMYYWALEVNIVNTLRCGCGDNLCAAPTTEAGVVFGTPTANAFCNYFVDISCTNPAFLLITNMDISNAREDPAELVCRSGSYFYSDNSLNDAVTNLQCGCDTNPCVNSLTVDAGAVVSAGTSDGNCVYTVDISCTNTFQRLILNSDTTNPIIGPEALTCNAGPPSEYIYNGPPSISVNQVGCQCRENQCINSFTSVGMFVVLSTPVPDGNCQYTVDVSCTVPTDLITINMATNNIRTFGPITLRCLTLQMKYFLNTVPVDTLDCGPRCPRVCGNLDAGLGMTVSDPIADANCVYTATATCTAGTMIEVELLGGIIIMVNSPHTFTCTATGTQWLVDDTVIPPQEVSRLIRCN